jgi:putative heme-binding domain-containing protein
VGTFAITADGADFYSTSPCNLIASDDEWASPILAEVGPDGNVWVIDWYNFIVQHNPTPQGFRTGRGNAYESDLRDKKHGRIYRVAYVGRTGSPSETAGGGNGTDGLPVRPTFTLEDATPDHLVTALKHSTMLWRKHAQRLLVERGETDVVPALIEQVNDQSTDPIGLNVGAIHALWTLKGLGALDKAEGEAFDAAVAALKHPSVGVRRNAVQVLPFEASSLKALLESGVANDKDAQVRLACLLALSDMPDGEGIGTAIGSAAMDDAVTRDRWLRDAATSAAAVHALPFFEHLVRVYEAPNPPGTSADAAYWPIVQRAAEHVARGRPSSEDVGKLIDLMQRGGGLFSQSVLAGLAAGWPREHSVTLTPASEKSLVAMLEIVPAGSKGQLIRLASLWGSKELEKYADEIGAALLASVSDTGASIRDRIAAARQLIGFQPSDAGVVTKVLALVTAQAAPELAEGLIAALSQSTADNVGPQLIARLQSLTPAARDAAYRALLSRPETTLALLDAADAGKASLTDLTLDQKQALGNHPSRRIRERAVAMLKAGGGLPNADRQKVLAELLPLAERKADAALGKEVFKKQCSKCHVHGTEGTRIGPDLTGMAVHPKHELLTNIIDPSRSVEGNFRVYTVVTTEGIVLNGMLASETRTSIELIDTEAKRHAIPREDIEELVGSTKSLMPEGFEKQVTQDDIANLLEFLAQRGKYLPLDLRKVATTVSTKGMFYNEEADAERLIFPDWSPRTFKDVPFVLVDPQGGRVANSVVLYGPIGLLTQRMPRSVTLLCNSPAKAIHFLSGVSGWGYPFSEEGSVSVIVRLHYADGETEDHELKNGVHFADYIRRVDVPGSEFAFRLRGQQIRYLSVQPHRSEVIKEVELVKGPDRTAPVVMAVTVETQ